MKGIGQMIGRIKLLVAQEMQLQKRVFSQKGGGLRVLYVCVSGGEFSCFIFKMYYCDLLKASQIIGSKRWGAIYSSRSLCKLMGKICVKV